MNPLGDQRPGPGRRKFVGDLAAPLLAVSLLLTGLILTSLPVPSADLGWIVYSPLPQRAFQLQGLVMIGAEGWTGIAMISHGLLILAFWSGYRLGFRRRPSAELP